MFKVDWDNVPELAQVSDEQMKILNSRNKFHSLPQNQWFKSRYRNNVKPQYLFYPEERRIQMELKQIFNVFDYNYSKTLDIAEMFLMFKHFGFEVSKNDLKVIYSYIDQDHDQALNYEEFKAFTENPSALKAFRNMMGKIEANMYLNAIDCKQKYVPLSVGAMLTYLSYMIRREKQINILTDKSITDNKIKYEAFTNLIMTKEKKTVVDEAYDLYIKAQYKLMNMVKNSSLRQLDLQLTKQQSKHLVSYSTIPGLQPILFQNLSMNDVDNIRELTKVVKLQTQMEITSQKSIQQMIDQSDISDEEFSEKENFLIKILLKAKRKGKNQAKSIITERLSQKQNCSVLSMDQVDEEVTPIKFRIQQQQSYPTQRFFKRQIRFNQYQNQQIGAPSVKYLHLEKSPQHQSTLATQDFSLHSFDMGTQSTRIKNLKLPEIFKNNS